MISFGQWSSLVSRNSPAYLVLSSSLGELELRKLQISEAEKQESLMDLEWEISCYCNMLYFMVQIFKGDDEFGDELSAYMIFCV